MDLPTWYFPVLSATVATMVMLRIGHALRAVLRRRPDEGVAQAWARGMAERDASLHAQTHALGSPRKTMIAMTGTILLLMLVLLWCLEDRWYGYLAALYFAAGVVVACQLDLTRGEHWPKLDLFDRAMCRAVHAWIWPAHVWHSRRNRQSCKDRDASFD